jgi:hypothetical protein
MTNMFVTHRENKKNASLKNTTPNFHNMAILHTANMTRKPHTDTTMSIAREKHL